MWDIGTWILLAAVVSVVALIVIFSILRGRRQRDAPDIRSSDEATPDDTLGDRRDVLRRARGRF